MLHKRGVAVYDYHVPWPQMLRFDGQDVAAQLGGRYLLYFLRDEQLGTLVDGSSRMRYVTPTPYPPTGDMISALALPFADVMRPFVLMLDPAKLSNVRGPRRVKGGDGIEYVLVDGFPGDAVIEMSADPSDRPSRWESRIS